jgi:methyltransferase (TIGR00027 family)
METGQPSRTSILVAAARAFGAREPDPLVRNPDCLAAKLLGPEELALIADHPISGALDQDYEKARENPEVAGLSNTMLARTKFVDEHLKRALDNGAEQVVILGAGFDTRAYRFAELLGGRRVFEVDYGPTQEIKRRRVAAAIGGIRENVVFAEIDFKHETLGEVLERAGYQRSRKTFFVWEGVSMYIAEDAVRGTLKTIASSAAPGSTLVMDFAEQALLDVLRKFPEAPQNRFTSKWHEPWIFGLPDGKEREFFRECGLEMREMMMLAGKAVAQRYLTRADGTKLAVRRVRAPLSSSKTMSPLRRLARGLGLFAFFARLMARRSKWYAIAELAVPGKA